MYTALRWLVFRDAAAPRGGPPRPGQSTGM
jgi:hypothetical protein